jgi:uncharacterized protein YndB with AHSA1/START domain/DNA-binding transcriptional ArsR family regulator
MDEVFKALADPSRRQLLDSLNDRNGQTLRELCSGLDMARQSVSKHLAVLEAANLVSAVRRGREKLHYLNPAPIHEITERWITHYDQPRINALADLKRALEEPTVDRPTFVYTTYIRTTPERLWQALTEPAFTKRYWGTTFDTDWQPGSTMSWELRGVTIDDPEQVVVAADPPRRLSYTWHTMTPDLAAALDLSDEARDQLRAERRSEVTFEIEPLDELVKLTVIHDGFDEGSLMAQMVTSGWPSVLSNLKTLLETGETLPLNQEAPPATRLGLTK